MSTLEAATRICERTGLALLSAEGMRGFRVGRAGYPAISAAPRSRSDSDRKGWGRYDVPGMTLYTGETAICAFTEVLQDFRRRLDGGDPLASDAEALDMTLDDFMAEVAGQWAEQSFMGMGKLPASWRHRRRMYRIRTTSDVQLVRLDHQSSLSAIERLCSPLLLEHGLNELTLETLHGKQREITSRIAERLRGVRLDDGRSPEGVHFTSKYAAGWCQGYWLETAGDSRLQVVADNEILVGDTALQTVAKMWGLRVF